MGKKTFDRPLPSEREKDKQLLEDASRQREEARRLREERVFAAFEAMLKTESGRVVWGWLHDRCGWVRPVLMRNSGGEVAAVTTECLAAQREIYREMRKMAPPELLKAAEFEAEFGDALAKTDKKKGER